MIGKILVIILQLVSISFFIFTTFNFIFNSINPIKVRYLLIKYKYKEPQHLLELKYYIYSIKHSLPLYRSFCSEDLDYYSSINTIYYEHRRFLLIDYDKAIIWYWIKQHNKALKKKSP